MIAVNWVESVTKLTRVQVFFLLDGEKYARVQLFPLSLNATVVTKVLWLRYGIQGHFTHESRAATMKLWEPIQKPSQATSNVVESDHGPLSVVWSHMWPGPQPNAIPPLPSSYTKICI
jgi:hypothetical protein